MTKFGKSLVFALVVILVCLSIVFLAGYHIRTLVVDVTVDETVVGNVTVDETVAITSPASFTLNLSPNDRRVYNMVVCNYGPTIVEVSAVAVVAPSGDGVTVELGSLTVVEPHTMVIVPVVVITTSDVVPGEYVVTVTVER